MLNAMSKGLGAVNIINFIKQNLHENCNNIPLSIIKQISIWELVKKQNRIIECLLIEEV